LHDVLANRSAPPARTEPSSELLQTVRDVAPEEWGGITVAPGRSASV